MAGNNLLEAIFTKFDNYTFYRTEVAVVNPLAFIVALATFGIIGFLAWKHGRSYCNTICPVGTLLGFPEQIRAVQNQDRQEQLQRLRRMRFEMQSVVHRPQDAYTVDYSRCIACFDCLDNCRQQAIQFSSTASKAAVPLAVKRAVSANGSLRLRNLPPCARPKRQALPNRPTGRGGGSSARCWRPPPCCPKHSPENRKSCYRAAKGTNGSIRSAPPERSAQPAQTLHGLPPMYRQMPVARTETGRNRIRTRRGMQPVMYFDRGFCNFDCTVCSDVCPTPGRSIRLPSSKST